MEFKRHLRKLRRFIKYVRELLLEQVTEKATIMYRTVRAITLWVANVLIPILVTSSIALIIYNVGFEEFYRAHSDTDFAHRVILLLLQILFTVRFIFIVPVLPRWRSRIFNLFLVILVFYLKQIADEIPTLDPVPEGPFTGRRIILFLGFVVLFITEISHILRFIYKRGVNPALLFVASFATLIVIGGFMLLLPNATTQGIHPVNAFFTSASAVCVTGLIVVDTATAFTLTGKVIIILLIQIGGLGIMTFAGMISFLVTGSVSFQNQLALGDMLSSSRISNVISFISRVVVVTITFEAIGALMIYGNLPEKMFNSEGEKIFFSVFHSVSAFCNAGFSTMTDGLYDGTIRYDYGLHWTVAALIILGGMGFPIVFNLFTFLRIEVTNIVKRIIRDPQKESYTNVLQATAKLSLVTYFILLLIGFAAFFIFEYNFTLNDHATLFGKITTSFFGSVTPRTAGFNTVDVNLLSLPMLMIYLLLMWIGASPGSTGGGIKTTVAAVAFLNMKSIVFGEHRTEAFRNEVSMASIRRAFGIILLSLLALGVTVLLLSIYDAEMGLLKLAFEAFSAFSTVGLTLGVTPQLSVFGKMVIMGAMFVGRVGALTLLFAIVTKHEAKAYRYPSEDIMF